MSVLATAIIAMISSSAALALGCTCALFEIGYLGSPWLVEVTKADNKDQEGEIFQVGLLRVCSANQCTELFEWPEKDFYLKEFFVVSRWIIITGLAALVIGHIFVYVDLCTRRHAVVSAIFHWISAACMFFSSPLLLGWNDWYAEVDTKPESIFGDIENIPVQVKLGMSFYLWPSSGYALVFTVFVLMWRARAITYEDEWWDEYDDCDRGYEMMSRTGEHSSGYSTYDLGGYDDMYGYGPPGAGSWHEGGGRGIPYSGTYGHGKSYADPYASARGASRGGTYGHGMSYADPYASARGRPAYGFP